MHKAHSLAFSTANYEHLRINAFGNKGIAITKVTPLQYTMVWLA